MTTEITTLTTSEAAARVGITGQYMRFLLSKGKGPKGTREGKGGRGGGYRFTTEAIDTWDAARVKRVPKGKTAALAATTIEVDCSPLPTNPELAEVTDLIKSMDACMGIPAEALFGGEHPLSHLARESMDPLGVEISGEDVDLLEVEVSGSGADAFKSLINAVCCAPEFAERAADHDGE